VTTVGVLILGGFYMVVAKPYEHGNAPAGDAHRLAARPAGSVAAPADA
jgi:hypothetical protein